MLARLSGKSGKTKRLEENSRREAETARKLAALEEEIKKKEALISEERLERLAMEEKASAERAMMIEIESEEQQRKRGIIMDKTEQGSEKFDLNMGTMGLVDKLEAHPAGKLLKNVVISNEAPVDREINIARLRKFKPQNDFSKMSLSDVPPFKLNKEFKDFLMTEAMTPEQFASLKPYVLVSDVFIHYIPMDSFFSVSSPVIFQLNDFRKVDNTTMRQYPLTHSGGYNILMTLDYCVAKEDLKHLTLSISTSLSSFRKDTSWASVKVILTISHMDFPVKANMQETMGVLHLADSDLTDFISDPRHADGVITPQAFELLKGHYKRGEIENINVPRDDKKEVNYAKTTMEDSNKDVNVRDLISEMRENALRGQRKENHSYPSSHKTPDPILKKRPVSPSKDDVVDDSDGLDDIFPGESMSEADSMDTVELPRNNQPSPQNNRSVNFS